MFAATSGSFCSRGFRTSPRSPPVHVTTSTSTPAAEYIAIVAAPLLDSSSGWACTAIRRNGSALDTRAYRPFALDFPGKPPPEDSRPPDLLVTLRVRCPAAYSVGLNPANVQEFPGMKLMPRGNASHYTERPTFDRRPAPRSVGRRLFLHTDSGHVVRHAAQLPRTHLTDRQHYRRVGTTHHPGKESPVTTDTETWLTQDAYDRLKAEFDQLSGPGRQELARKI